MSCRLQRSSASHGGGFGSGSCQLGGGCRVATCSSRFVSGGSAGGCGGAMSCGFGGGYGSGFGKVLGLALVNLVMVMAAPLTGNEIRVRDLKEANTHLEVKVRDAYQKQSRDNLEEKYSQHFKTIEELKSKLLKVLMEQKIILQMDIPRLAAGDFRTTYEIERGLRQFMEAEMSGLYRVLDELSLAMADLDIQTKRMNEELGDMKKKLEEEMKGFRNQVVGQVNVGMDATTGIELTRVLAEMQVPCEALAKKNRRDAEARFQSKSTELNKEVSPNAGMMQTSKTEITELRRMLQGLEMELQSQLSMKAGLEGTLTEMEYPYALQLQQIQGLISGIEAQLSELRSEMECQNQEYKMLLDIKTRLDQKIAPYSLLEGQDAKTTDFPTSGGSAGVSGSASNVSGSASASVSSSGSPSPPGRLIADARRF